MKNDLVNNVNTIHNRNCIYQVAYHVVWCPKYRKQILVDKIAEYLNAIIDEIYDGSRAFVS